MPTDPVTKVDRSLVIVCTPTLVWRGDGGIGATMAYKQTEAVPNMPNAVDANGNITLLGWPGNKRFTDNIDVYFFLDSSKCVDAQNNPITVRWATLTESTPPSVGCIWFCATPALGQPKNSTPITVPGMSTGRISDTLVYIDDNTPGGGPAYSFCTAIVIPDRGNYYITIDPVIGGKGVGGNR